MNKAIRIERNIIFGRTDTEDLAADVYLPATGRDYPAVLLLHGGAWKIGSKEMYADWGPFLAEAGFVAIAVNYRLSASSYPTWPGVLDDVRLALDWFVRDADKWNINPQRVGVIGDSAGAHLAALLALDNVSRAKICAVIGVYGVYDVKKFWEYTKKTRNDDPVGRLIGASPDEAPEEYRKASPFQLLKGVSSHSFINTSFFFIWGDSDEVVPPSYSEDFAASLQQAGISVKTLSIPGQGHFWFNICPLPGIESGTVQDYPNTLVAPILLDFLKSKLASEEVP